MSVQTTPSGPTIGLPFQINDTNISARVAAFDDTARMNPNAASYFFTSAIPVKGDAYYGAGGQTGFTANGTSAGFNFSGAGNDLTGHVQLEAVTQNSQSFQVTLPAAYVKWKRLTIGAADSTFTDLNALPESGDLAGPIGRPAIRSTMGVTSQPQIRFGIVEPKEFSGLYVNAAIEQPTADVEAPIVTPVAGLSSYSHYSSFSRYPDMVGSVRYQVGGTVTDDCTKAPVTYENWHIQFGAVVRDLGIEDDRKGVVPVVREETTGWGAQLSGRCTVIGNDDPVHGLHDYAMFSITFGEGIGRYFADLHDISATNDAAYNVTTGLIQPLPVFAYFGGYEHDWTEHLHSSFVYSHIDLDSQMIPGNPAAPYKRGDYFSVNLVWQELRCIPSTKPPTDGQPNPGTQFALYAGTELLFGDRETLSGAAGSDSRLMVFFGASH